MAALHKRVASLALADWREAPAGLLSQVKAARLAASDRLEVGQRFHRVGVDLVVWRVLRVYRDGQGLEHAILASNRRDLDPKTLSAAALLDSKQYRLI